MTIIPFILIASLVLVIYCSVAYSGQVSDHEECCRRPCAWCDKENRVERLDKVSYGICPRHAEMLEMECNDESHDSKL